MRKFVHHLAALFALAAVVFMVGSAMASDAPVNILPNPSFEEGSNLDGGDLAMGFKVNSDPSSPATDAWSGGLISLCGLGSTKSTFCPVVQAVDGTYALALHQSFPEATATFEVPESGCYDFTGKVVPRKGSTAFYFTLKFDDDPDEILRYQMPSANTEWKDVSANAYLAKGPHVIRLGLDTATDLSVVLDMLSLVKSPNILPNGSFEVVRADKSIPINGNKFISSSLESPVYKHWTGNFRATRFSAAFCSMSAGDGNYALAFQMSANADAYNTFSAPANGIYEISFNIVSRSGGSPSRVGHQSLSIYFDDEETESTNCRPATATSWQACAFQRHLSAGSHTLHLHGVTDINPSTGEEYDATVVVDAMSIVLINSEDNLSKDFVVGSTMDEYGDAHYGVNQVAAGDIIEAPEFVELGEGHRVKCVGWRLSAYDKDFAAYVELPARAGTGCAFTVLAEDVDSGRKLEWDWQHEWRLSADAAGVGAVSVNGGAPASQVAVWFTNGAPVEVCYLPPDAGTYRYLVGVPETAVRPSASAVRFASNGTRVVTAVPYAYEDELLVCTDPSVMRKMPYEGRFVYVFTNAAIGTFPVYMKQTATYEESLVVAGGGCGGTGSIAGGGGAGGLLRDQSAQVMKKGAVMSVTVGAGGAAGSGKTVSNGGNSMLSFGAFALEAIGGGHGNVDNKAAGDGGSGGGGGTGGTATPAGVGTPGQGHDGVRGTYSGGAAGGGGGAGEPGGYPVNVVDGVGCGGKGGDGIWETITGVRLCYAGGGGGGATSKNFDDTGAYTDPPGEGGLGGGGRAGVRVLPTDNSAGLYSLYGQDGADGFGGGGGAIGVSTAKSGRGGNGTVIIAISAGDKTERRFATELASFPFDPLSPAEPVPTVRDGKTGMVLQLGTDYTLAYEGNELQGRAYLVVIGKEGSNFAGVVQRFAFDVVGVRYVTPDASEEGSGVDWDHPMTLAKAIEGLATTSYDIWCKAGTYVFPAGDAALDIARSVSIRGGFAGTADNVSAKAANQSKTVFDGAGESCGAFTIKYVTSASEYTRKSVRFEDCTFTRFMSCAVSKSGGGSRLEFEDCDFIGNVKTNGVDLSPVLDIANNQSNNVLGQPVPGPIAIRNCRFCGNIRGMDETISSRDGILHVGNADLTIENCLFVTNGASFEMPPRCFFVRNVSGCALIYQTGGSLTIRGTRFAANTYASASSSSSFVNQDKGVLFLMENCAFVGNQYFRAKSGGRGALVYVNSNDAKIRNCTFAYNVLDQASMPVIRHYRTLSSNPYHPIEVKNCIFWGNVFSEVNTGNYDLIDEEGAVSYSLFESDGAYAPSGIASQLVFEDPRFIGGCLEGFVQALTYDGTNNWLRIDSARLSDVVSFDVHLKRFSPAVNSGDPASDWRQEPKPNGKRINMGAYGGTAEAACTPPGMAVRVK